MKTASYYWKFNKELTESCNKQQKEPNFHSILFNNKNLLKKLSNVQIVLQE